MNSRSCERLNGFAVILGGYLTMASGLTVINGMKAMSLVQSFEEHFYRIVSMQLMGF